MVRALFPLSLLLPLWGCSGIDDCLETEDPPIRGDYISESACDAQIRRSPSASGHKGPTRFHFDFEEGVVILEYEIEKADGRIVPVKETWRQIR